MDLKDIKAIIDLMKKNSISEFELERQDFKIRLKRGGAANPQIGSYDEVQAGYVSGGTVATVVPMPLPAPGQAAATTDMEIKAPMIGTFYRAPSPEAANYVEVGTEVNADTATGTSCSDCSRFSAVMTSSSTIEASSSTAAWAKAGWAAAVSAAAETPAIRNARTGAVLRDMKVLPRARAGSPPASSFA